MHTRTAASPHKVLAGSVLSAELSLDALNTSCRAGRSLDLSPEPLNPKPYSLQEMASKDPQRFAVMVGEASRRVPVL